MSTYSQSVCRCCSQNSPTGPLKSLQGVVTYNDHFQTNPGEFQLNINGTTTAHYILALGDLFAGAVAGSTGGGGAGAGAGNVYGFGQGGAGVSQSGVGLAAQQHQQDTLPSNCLKRMLQTNQEPNQPLPPITGNLTLPGNLAIPGTIGNLTGPAAAAGSESGSISGTINPNNLTAVWGAGAGATGLNPNATAGTGSQGGANTQVPPAKSPVPVQSAPPTPATPLAGQQTQATAQSLDNEYSTTASKTTQPS